MAIRYSLPMQPIDGEHAILMQWDTPDDFKQYMDTFVIPSGAKIGVQVSYAQGSGEVKPDGQPAEAESARF